MYRVDSRKVRSKNVSAYAGLNNMSGMNNILLHMRKVTSHPYLVTEDEFAIDEQFIRVSSKIELVDRLIPKLVFFQHKTVIICQMRSVMRMIEVILRFRQIRYERYEASMTNTQRQAAINSFHNQGVAFFLISTRAGGQGLNLQVADTVIHFEADFNPHFDENAVDWVLRFGQKEHAKVLRLVATVESRITLPATHNTVNPLAGIETQSFWVVVWFADLQSGHALPWCARLARWAHSATVCTVCKVGS